MKNHKTTCRICNQPSKGKTYCSDECNIVNYSNQGATKVKLRSIGEFVNVKEIRQKALDTEPPKVLTEMKLDWHLRGEPFKK